MSKISFSVPGNPIPKGRPRFARKGGSRHVYTPSRTKDYERAVAQHAMIARIGHGRINAGDVGIRAVVYRKDSRRFDLDNVLKSIMDGCNGVLWMDDSQVSHIEIRRITGNPRIDVEVWRQTSPNDTMTRTHHETQETPNNREKGTAYELKSSSAAGAQMSGPLGRGKDR